MSSAKKSSPPYSRLLTLRLSPQQYQEYVASRKPQCTPGQSNSTDKADTSSMQAIVVRGYNADAVAAIEAATAGKADHLKTTYVNGKDMSTIVDRVEELLLIPAKHWRLTPRAVVKIPEDTLVGDSSKKASQRPIELVLVPEDAVVCYLTGHEYMREWKRLKPAETAIRSSSDTLPHAQALFHLLSPAPDPHWGRYTAQRQEAEWTYARMRERLGMELTIGPFTEKIKYGIESILQHTKLSENEQAVVADGVLPQGMEVWDDHDEGVYLLDVKAFTRIFSPTRPSMVDVYLFYPCPHRCQVFYRIHDPAPPAEERLKIFHIRSAEKVVAGRDGWRLVFDVRIDEAPRKRGRGTKDIERSTWELRKADAERLHDVLFSNGELGDKISLLDAVLFVLASVGFHLRMRNPAQKYSRDEFGGVDGPEFQIGKCEWIATNLRAACGAPLPDEKAETRQVVEDDSDYGRDALDDEDEDDEDDGPTTWLGL